MMTAVRSRVARSESTPSRPILAKMAVRAAKTADRTAQWNQYGTDDMSWAPLRVRRLGALARPAAPRSREPVHPPRRLAEQRALLGRCRSRRDALEGVPERRPADAHL